MPLLLTIFYFVASLTLTHAMPKALVCSGQCSASDAAKFHENYKAVKANPTEYVQKRYGHQLFDFLQPYYNCPGKVARYPEDQKVDGGKYVCGSIKNNVNRCIIYSLGSANDFTWEKIMFDKFNCEIHAFDCTVNDKWTIPDYVSFHPWCIDQSDHDKYYSLTTVMSKLNHQYIDFLKVDIEGYEYGALKALESIEKQHLPRQLAVELHHSVGDKTPIKNRIGELNKITELYDLFIKLGYELVTREDNYLSSGCTEILLVLKEN